MLSVVARSQRRDLASELRDLLRQGWVFYRLATWGHHHAVTSSHRPDTGEVGKDERHHCDAHGEKGLHQPRSTEPAPVV